MTLIILFFNTNFLQGCTRHPAPGKKFCSDHRDFQSPVLLPSQIAKESLEKLNKQHKLSSNLEPDMLFIIEAILEVKGDSVLVKWEGYKESTWEPLSNMPEFVVQFVEQNGCGKIPEPVVKHEKVIDGNKHILLEWKNDVGDKDVLWQKEKIDESEDVFKCDTKKDKDKRVCHHTFGINIACWPCGVVVMFKVDLSVYFKGLNVVLQELFGSESASQVYAQITEWMATLPRDKLRKVKWLLYDDMCHLGIKVSASSHLHFII